MIPKFRAWNKEDKSWIDIKSLGMTDGEITTLEEWDDDLPYFVEDLGKTWELMQSTGLRDKNGMEIFEGDIFKAPFDIGPAGFSMCKGVVEYDLEQGYQWQYLLLSELEIMGNIYENPELLEKENNK